ncbi:hypothetical protein PFICI_10578 [Pestalotiopsis fici W106-1]|uniref:Uncharacterized protein n=1 Tax=Pestalotiopsis fici (strain W106-1 / CGMCC3.15140) TaxID=1229662 RepID=W3X043_PESFW|nr:uncharacterized protein PFICI_10578 [Pestalotiopsis fici W106-1]ETS78516.1 hypothetical protein PFICI_10578 [Pestalotiopsis fici W106-1]
MAYHNDSVTHDDDKPSKTSNDYTQYLSQSMNSSKESDNDELKLQPFGYEASRAHPRTFKSLQPSPDPLPTTSVLGSLWTPLAAQSNEEFRLECQITNPEYGFTKQDDNSRRCLLGGQESMASQPLSSVSASQSDTIVEPPMNHPRSPEAAPVRVEACKSTFSAHRYWAWEISASILGIACIASVVGVLIHEQNKPLSQWGLGQRYLSPNVVVSFLGALAKSACLVAVAEIVSQLKWLHFHNSPQELNDLQLFDEASRGPWGALQLALRKNLRTLLATSASIITIASLLIDPFIQSVFQFPSILTPISEINPPILSSQIYNPSSESFYQECHNPLNNDLQAAVLRPIYNAIKEPLLPCSVERCEWPTITTLGVCSHCIDLRTTIASTCHFSPSKSDYDLKCNYTLQTINKTFKAGFDNGDGDGVGVGSISKTGAHFTVWTSIPEYVGEDEPIKLPSQPAVISKFAFVQFDSDMHLRDYLPRDPGSWDNFTSSSTPPVKQAGQCTMQLCAKTFETPYYGNFTASNLTGPQAPLIINDKVFAESTHGTLMSLNLGSGSDVLMPTNTTFQFNYCEYAQLASYLYSLFNVAMDSKGVVDDSRCGVNTTLKFVPNVGMQLGKVDDVSTLVSQVADSLTEEIRTSVNSSATSGVAKQSEVFIVIRWAWLVLPISVTVLTFALLLVVIMTNHARGLPPWRNSSLALLFHKVDGWDSSEMVFSNHEDMAVRAKEMKAQVTYQEGMLLFSKVE